MAEQYLVSVSIDRAPNEDNPLDDVMVLRIITLADTLEKALQTASAHLTTESYEIKLK